MATAAITALLTDILLNNASPPTGFGTSNSEFSEDILNRMGTTCGSNGHDGTLGPATNPTNPNQYCGSSWTVTQNLTGLHLHVWLRGMYPLRSKALGGLAIYVSDNGGNTGMWFISGSDLGYSGDWLHGVIDCSRAFDISSGTPNLANITEIGGGYNISATKGADILYPFFFDAIRKENGSGQNGIRIVGGTTGDRLLFGDLPIGDETLRTGIAEVSRGNIFAGGEWHFGNAASTMYLQDDAVTVNAADLPVANDYYKLVFNDGTTGITDFRVTKLTWKGVSRLIPWSYDTSALGVGDTHDCPDETFNFFSTITFGLQTTKLRPVFNDCVNIVPNGIPLTNAGFNNSDRVTLTTANDAITGGSTNLHSTVAGIAFVLTDSPAKISVHSFNNTGGVGHAVEATTIGSYAYNGNTHTGYGANGTTSAAFYNNSGGAITLNIGNGGDTPTVRNGVGASTTIVAGAVIVRVRVLDNLNVVLPNAAVHMEAAIGGVLPAYDSVTLSVVGTLVTVTHTGHGMISGDKVKFRATVQIIYNIVAVITVTGVNNYTYNLTSSPASGPTGPTTATFVALNGLTDVNGEISASRVYGANQTIEGDVRKANGSPLFQSAQLIGPISSANGLFNNIKMIPDE